MTTNLNKSIMVSVSSGLHESALTWAQQHNTSVSAIVRDALAAHIGYDLASDPKAIHANKKYANERERYVAMLARERAERAVRREAREALAQGDKRRQVEILARSLGIDPDTLRFTHEPENLGA